MLLIYCKCEHGDVAIPKGQRFVVQVIAARVGEIHLESAIL